MLWDDYSVVEREMMRIKATLSKNVYKELLNDIDKTNKDIREITHQNVYLEPLRKRRQSRRPIADLKLIRKHAASLYQVFVTGKAWKCGGKSHHLASLRLDPRSQTLEGTIKASASAYRFRILLSTSDHGQSLPKIQSQWHEIEVAPSFGDNQVMNETINIVSNVSQKSVRFASASQVGVITAQPNPFTHQECSLIADICSAIHVPQGANKKAIGFLVDEKDQEHKHYVYRTDTGIGPEPQSKSLGELLGAAQQQQFVTTSLSRGDRLQIAVTLASSVLQLDGTSWLESEWTSNDIYFHKKDRRANDESYLHPYLPWKPCKSHGIIYSNTIPCAQATKLEHLMDRCQVLFALGLILVELCFGRTLLAMQRPEDHDVNQEKTKYMTARRLLNSVYSEMGTSYGDVVRRCLFQPFDVRDMSLENEILQQKVFEDVVIPLTEDLNNFNGRLKIM